MNEWNRRSTTQPINIAPSYGEYNGSNNMEYSRDLNDHGDLDLSFNNLTVGSLPSIRRERRLIVSSGNNEFSIGQRHPSGNDRRRHSGIGIGISGLRSSNSSNRRKQHSDSSIIHEMSMASSMPVPRAPFLASRNDQASGEQLSRIPNIALPESASESFSSSVHYGSLNESKFRFPNSTSYQSRSGNVPPNSPNSNQSGAYNLQQRVEKLRNNSNLIKNETKSGIAALLGDNSNDKDVKEKNQDNNNHSTSPKQSLGIGALLNEFGQNQNNIHAATNKYSAQKYLSSGQTPIPSSIKFGSNSTNASVLTMPNQSQNTTTSQYLESNPLSNNQTRTPAVMIPNNSNQYGKQNNDNHTTSIESSPNNQICGSLTGLDILKQTPRGMARLNPQETKAILDIQARSRSYSDEVRNFLNDRMDSNNNAPALNKAQQDYDSVVGYHNDDVGGMRHRYTIGNIPQQRRFSNSSDISFNNGDQTVHDPDIDGAFDLDMDC